jgi:type II secretory pathway component PulJ
MHAKKNESSQQQKYKQFNEVQAVEGVLRRDLNTAQENQLKKMKRPMPQKVP